MTAVQKVIVITLLLFLHKSTYCQTKTDTTYLKYAKRVTAFSLNGSIIEKHGHDGQYISIRNKAGQILQLKVMKDSNLTEFYGSRTFILNEYQDGYIKKITYFNEMGEKINRTGEGLFNECTTEFIILKKQALINKIQNQSECEGSINKTDDKKEKIIMVKYYNKQGNVLHTEYLGTCNYLQYQDLIYWD